MLRCISSVQPLNNRYWENFREHFLSLLPNSRPLFLFTHLDHATSSSRGTNWPISMTVYLMDGWALAEMQEKWTANRCFIFLFPSSRASRTCRAPREISHSPRLAHKAPVMQPSLPRYLHQHHTIAYKNSFAADSDFMIIPQDLIFDVLGYALPSTENISVKKQQETEIR